MPGQFRMAVVTAVALLSGCGGQSDQMAQSRVNPARCAALRPADSIATSRAGFLQEVLDARPTPQTPRFDAYHEGSYHVDKDDLAGGLVEVAGACGIPLVGALIVGPVGPLWTYHVTAFLGETSGRTRVNSLVMPHARITGKTSGVLPAPVAESLFTALVTSPLLGDGAAPPEVNADTSTLGREFRYDVLVLRLHGDSVLLRHGSLRDHPGTAAVRRLVERVNQLLTQLQSTYSHGQASGEGNR